LQSLCHTCKRKLERLKSLKKLVLLFIFQKHPMQQTLFFAFTNCQIGKKIKITLKQSKD